jgi:Transposase DDE domain
MSRRPASTAPGRSPGPTSKRGASKWRCPTGECKPASPPRWRKVYSRRAAVERQFGRLKNEWALLPLRVRGLDRVALHADLTILATLACALARTRVAPSRHSPLRKRLAPQSIPFASECVASSRCPRTAYYRSGARIIGRRARWNKLTPTRRVARASFASRFVSPS